MTLIEHFQKMFSYETWANRQIVSSLEAIAEPPQRSVQWLAHMMSAQMLWLQRLQHYPQTYPVWPEFTFAKCKEMSESLLELWKKYLQSLSEADLSAPIAYKNSKGESYSNSRNDILQHVIIHSAHHRGQIVADIRAAGYIPPYLDFIQAVRTGQME